MTRSVPRPLRAAVVRLAPLLLAACVVTQSTAPTQSPPSTPASQLALRVLVTALTDLDASGPPLPGAHVCAATTRGSERCTEAASDGVASFSLPPATYLLRVDGPDATRWMTDNRVIDVTGADTAVWIGLPARVRISGVVRNQVGAPVVRAQACAHPISRIDVQCARSGADGKYTIETRGDIYRLDVEGPPGAKLVPMWAGGGYVEDDAALIDARASDVGDIDFALEPASCCVAPCAWPERRSRTRSVSPDARSTTRLAVRAHRQAWCVHRAARGRASTGSGRFRPIASRHRSLARPSTRGFPGTPVDLSADATLNMTLPNGPPIRGHVRTSRASRCPMCTSRGHGFHDRAHLPADRFDGAYAVTTRPNTYIINVVRPRSGYIAEYLDRKRNWVDADEVRLGTGDIEVDLVVRRGVIVKGTIKDKRGVPAVSATITSATRATWMHAGATDGMGAFEVVVVPASITSTCSRRASPGISWAAKWRSMRAVPLRSHRARGRRTLANAAGGYIGPAPAPRGPGSSPWVQESSVFGRLLAPSVVAHAPATFPRHL